jgi:TolB-like protein
MREEAHPRSRARSRRGARHGIQRSGDRIRMNVQLIDARTDRQARERWKVRSGGSPSIPML